MIPQSPTCYSYKFFIVLLSRKVVCRMWDTRPLFTRQVIIMSVAVFSAPYVVGHERKAFRFGCRRPIPSTTTATHSFVFFFSLSKHTHTHTQWKNGILSVCVIVLIKTNRWRSSRTTGSEFSLTPAVSLPRPSWTTPSLVTPAVAMVALASEIAPRAARLPAHPLLSLPRRPRVETMDARRPPPSAKAAAAAEAWWAACRQRRLQRRTLME